MTITDAKKVMTLMFAWYSYHDLAGKKPEAALPQKWDLSYMLDANEAIKKSNSRLKDQTKIFITMEDRLIAALYVAMQYEGAPIAVEAKSVANANGNFVFVIKE